MAVTGSSSRLPTKWAVGLISLFIAYALLQPQLNSRLGWSLPSLADLQQSQPVPAPSPSESKRPNASESDNSSATDRSALPPNSADSPAKHGVFDGDMPQVLRWLDEAYALGRRGGRGVSVHSEDGRTVYEVHFPKAVGYIGGRDGGRQHHPDARQIRLVLEGDKVITAFPF